MNWLRFASSWRRLPAPLLLLALGVACEDGQPFSTGEGEALLVEGGTYDVAPIYETSREPEVLAAFLSTPVFPERTQHKSFSGVLSARSTAVTIALRSSPGVETEGRWWVAAGPPLPDFPDLPSFTAPLSFSRELLPGPYQLELRAWDDDGKAGPVRTVDFSLTALPAAEGELMFTLSWDRDADLDLRVETPSGEEISRSNPRVGVSEEAGGSLDFDSNGACRLDGRRVENVVWAAQPASGRYRARVDTFSLCEEEAVRWRLTATRAGRLVAAAEGLSTSADLRYVSQRGSGLLALQLEVE